jgi:hypothetical protein
MPEVFYPVCTFPDDEAGIVAGPDMRGTLDIVWSCLAVVILCTWVVLHENVPAEGDTNHPDWKQRRLLDLYLAAQKTCAFGWALFAPELFTGKAMMGLYFARHVRDIVRKSVSIEEVDWTLHHAFLANMGGFSIEFDETTPVDVPSVETRPGEPDKEGGVLVDIGEQSPADSCAKPFLLGPRPSNMSPGQLEAQKQIRLYTEGD